LKKNDGLIDQVFLEKYFGLENIQMSTSASMSNKNPNIFYESLFYNMYRRCPDIVIVIHLKHKTTQNEMIAMTSHFHWNPKHPHIKSLQCYLLSIAVDRLVTEKWNLDNENIPIVFGLDPNSLPVKHVGDVYDPVIPEGGLRNGGYELFTQWKLPCIHRDHPYFRVAEDLEKAIKAKQENKIVITPTTTTNENKKEEEKKKRNNTNRK